MNFDEARDAVLALLRQQGKAKNSEMLALVGGDVSLLERVREDLLFAELADDVRGAGLRYAGPDIKATDAPDTGPLKLFLSYGRRDASALADRLEKDLKSKGFEVWRDTREIKPGTNWQEEITDGLRSAQIVIAVMTPHSTRTTRDAVSPDTVDSVCLGEIAYALFNPPPQPIVPVMAQTCEPPLAIFHLDYVDLRQWQDSEDQYQAGLVRLLDGISAARRGEKRYRSWHHLLDPFDFASFLYAKREGFTGRRWLFDAINLWRQSADRDRALLIKGDPGTGKSAVVAELVHRNPGSQVLAYHCCQWDVAQSLEPWRFVRSIAAMIAGKLEDYAALLVDPNVRDILSEASCREDPASAFERGVLTPLQHLYAPEGGTRYLLVDALDEALLVPPGQPDLVSVLASRMERLPPWLRLVATTRKEPAVLERLAGLRAEEIEAQSPDNLADLRAYIQGRLESPSLAERVSQVTRSAAELAAQLVDKSAGNFLYARQALDGVATGIHSLAALETLPPGLRGLYAERFAKLFPDETGFAPARALLAVICAAREPVGRELLAEASGLDMESALPRTLVRLAAYVPRRASKDGQAVYAVFHKSFADWLTDPERAGQFHHVAEIQGHRRLADRGWQQYLAGVATMQPYFLRHLAAHLLESGRWNDLCTWLTDFHCLDFRIRAGQIFAVVTDQRAAIASLPEFEAETETDRKRVKICAEYGEALIAYAHHRVVGKYSTLPQPPPTGHAMAKKDIPEERSLRAARLRAMANFTSQQATLLAAFPEDFLPLAANAADGPPWADATEPADASKRTWVKRTPCPPTPPLRPQCLQTLHGHTSLVGSVSITPDGSRAVSGGEDKTVRVWDLSNGQCLRTLSGHTSVVSSVSITPDGRRAISGSRDKALRVWDLASGRCLHMLSGDSTSVSSVSITPDASRAVSGCSDGRVRVWNLASGECLRTLLGHTSKVYSVSVTPDGSRIVSGSKDNTLCVWDLATGLCLHSLRGHTGPVLSVCVTHDGSRAVSGSCDGTLRLWDLVGGRCLHILQGHGGWVNSVSVTSDGSHAVSGSEDNTMRVWNLACGQCVQTLRGHTSCVNSVSVTPDGTRAVSGSSDCALRVWDLTGECPDSLHGHMSSVHSIRITPDGSRAVSGSRDKTLCLWELATGRCIHTLRGHTASVSSVSVTPDGSRAVSGSSDSTLRIWDLASGQSLGILQGHTSLVSDVSVTSDGARAVSASEDKTLRVWDLARGHCVHILQGHTSLVTNVSIAPDGRRAVSGSFDSAVCVWDLVDGQCLHKFRGHMSYVNNVKVTPEGSRAVSGSCDSTLRVWDLASGRCLHVFKGHMSYVNSVCVTPDGSRTVSASSDCTLRVWDLTSGKCLHTLEGHADQVLNVSVTPDGSRAVSGSRDNTLRVWDLASGRCLAIYHAGTLIGPMAISSNEARIACGAKDGQMHFLTMRNFA